MCHDWVMETSHAGKVLVATPRLIDPNFFRTVILLLQHDDEGTVGIVLNRETSETVADHLPEWAGLVTEPGLIHFGGPVEPEIAIGISSSATGESTGVPGLSIVDLGTDPQIDASPIRVYSGYSGWGAGQLEEELAEGSWYVVQGSPDDPFDTPVGQWARILRRQSGHLALVSTFPEDVTLN